MNKKILVINTGSSSLKFRLFGYEKLDLISNGIVERIGEEEPQFCHKINDQKIQEKAVAPNHKAAFKVVIDDLVNPARGLLKDVGEIAGVGHRVVHGADTFSGTVRIDDAVIKKMEECIPLAPLHNPPNLMGIHAAQSLMPDVPHVGVFDTAFHQTLEPRAFLYGLPYELYEKHRIRRYGFHGTSHKYVVNRLAKILDRPLKGLKIVTCHLGNGSSLAAVKDGISVDTTMGMTPMEGVMMGTRTGDLDPIVPLFIMDKENLSRDEVDKMMNKKSGVLGLSGVSNDFRDLWEAADKGHKRARLTLEVFCYRIKKYIGAYAAAMGGLTDVIFTAGIGERDPGVREMVCSNMEFLGIRFNGQINENKKDEGLISTGESQVRVWIIPTDEELMIARDTKELIESLVNVRS
jgi:acetate kinase